MDSLISRLDQALNGEKRPVFVFDIDSTIFNVSPRNQDIFDLFCSIYAKKLPGLRKIASETRLSYKDWGLRPYIKLIENQEKLKKSAYHFWQTHFFSGTFLHSDQPYSGILELIELFHQQGAHILYLTGRDNHRMRKGSLLQLKHWTLPLEKDEDLITKPHKVMIDGDYKSSELKKIFALYPEHPIFFLDNEPSVLEHCLFPEKTDYLPVFIDSTHSNRSTPQDSWVKLHVHDYPKVLAGLKK